MGTSEPSPAVTLTPSQPGGRQPGGANDQPSRSLAVSQASRGPQSVLRPGDYFGEVALAMNMPRTASVRALTPATVASCDRTTFEAYVRPLFADDEQAATGIALGWLREHE